MTPTVSVLQLLPMLLLRAWSACLSEAPRGQGVFPADRFGVPARLFSGADLQLPLGNGFLSARLCMCVLGLPLCLTPMC